MQFVLASHNKKKRAEMETILRELGISVVPLPVNAPEPEETGVTFEQNAVIKAESAAAFTGQPAIADDSGLCVDALDGAPGVLSARYGSQEYVERAGEQGFALLLSDASDADRTRLLLEQMEPVPEGARQARFVCAIACVIPKGNQMFTVRGECQGEISRRLHGSGGFGYDPVFYVPEYGCTFGELSAEVKNRISHRARALQALKTKLKDYIQNQAH